MASCMPGTAPQWLLLDVPSAPGAGRFVREQFTEAPSVALFEDTEWHGLREHGPLLVDLQQSPALASLCHLDAHAWPGLLLCSAAPLPTLLTHLRRMLCVTFGLHQKALLSYYNAHTASYFFDGCNARELSCWLGPISLLRWFGGTWADRGIGSQGWQHLLNPGLAVPELQNEHTLSARQQIKLQECLLERHAWQWCRATAKDYRSLWRYLQQGLTLGFTDRAVLDDWLWLRLQYPHAGPVPRLVGASQRERLEHLLRLWRMDHG